MNPNHFVSFFEKRTLGHVVLIDFASEIPYFHPPAISSTERRATLPALGYLSMCSPDDSPSDPPKNRPSREGETHGDYWGVAPLLESSMYKQSPEMHRKVNHQDFKKGGYSVSVILGFTYGS